MAPDPIPNHSILVHYGKRAAAEPDSRGIDLVFTFQLLELQTGIRRVIPKNAISTFRVALRIRRKAAKRRQNVRVARETIKGDHREQVFRRSRLLEGHREPSGESRPVWTRELFLPGLLVFDTSKDLSRDSILFVNRERAYLFQGLFK